MLPVHKVVGRRRFNGTPFASYVTKPQKKGQSASGVKNDWSTTALLKAIDPVKRLEDNLQLGAPYYINQETGEATPIVRELPLKAGLAKKLTQGSVSGNPSDCPMVMTADAVRDQQPNSRSLEDRLTDIFDTYFSEESVNKRKKAKKAATTLEDTQEAPQDQD